MTERATIHAKLRRLGANCYGGEWGGSLWVVWASRPDGKGYVGAYHH